MVRRLRQFSACIMVAACWKTGQLSGLLTTWESWRIILKAHPWSPIFEPKPQWLAKVVTSMQSAVESNKLTQGDARSLQGKLIHLSSACEGKVSRGQVHGFKEYISSNSFLLTEELKSNLLFHLSLIQLQPWKIVRLENSTIRPVIVYTDAACEPNDEGFP